MLLQINSSYFSKIALAGLHYESVSLDVKEVWFEVEQDNHGKVKALLNGVDVENEM